MDFISSRSWPKRSRFGRRSHRPRSGSPGRRRRGCHRHHILPPGSAQRLKTANNPTMTPANNTRNIEKMSTRSSSSEFRNNNKNAPNDDHSETNIKYNIFLIFRLNIYISNIVYAEISKNIFTTDITIYSPHLPVNDPT